MAATIQPISALITDMVGPTIDRPMARTESPQA
jgi:hypothetical protein